MEKQEFIAERNLYALAPDGRGFELTIGVGRPYQISENESACAVCLDGLHNRLSDQHGIDSWQALQLAYQLVAQLLTYFVQDGGQLFGRKMVNKLHYKISFQNNQPSNKPLNAGRAERRRAF